MTKVRLRFRKDGDLRFLSHHDLMRLFERLLRRTGLPFRSSEGFNPKPKMSFASALSLGIVGLEEAVEIEFHCEHDAEAVRLAFAKLQPEGITFFAARALPKKASGLPVFVEYRLALPPETLPGLQGKLDHLLAQPELWIERPKQREAFRTADEAPGEERLDAPLTASPGKRLPPEPPKRLDLRQYLQAAKLDDGVLHFRYAVTPGGTGRPEELLKLLGLEGLLADGANVLERTRLALADETETSETQTAETETTAAPAATPPSAAWPTPPAAPLQKA